MSDPPALVQMRDISTQWGRSLRIVRSWRERWVDWPAPVEERRTADSRGGLVAFYDAEAVAQCVAAHLPADPSADRWNVEQVANELGVTVATVQRRVRRGDFPPADGHQARWPWWRPETVRTWTAQHLVPPNAWTAIDVRAYTGHLATSCVRHGLAVDGTAGSKRWWWSAHVRRWWSHYRTELEWLEQQRQLLQSDRATAIADGVSLDLRERWFGPDIAEATGLSYSSIRTYRRQGRLPEPDGYTAGGRPWWEPTTIWRWDRDRPKSGSSLGGRPLGSSRRGISTPR